MSKLSSVLLSISFSLDSTGFLAGFPLLLTTFFFFLVFVSTSHNAFSISSVDATCTFFRI